MKPSDVAVRFAFGAAIALAAGVIGMRFGPLIGGLFLAFPAVLPASLTLLEKRNGLHEADVDARGAILGACGMVAFAFAAHFALRPLGVAAIAVAWVVWILVAVALFLAVRAAVGRPG